MNNNNLLLVQESFPNIVNNIIFKRCLTTEENHVNTVNKIDPHTKLYKSSTITQSNGNEKQSTKSIENIL